MPVEKIVINEEFILKVQGALDNCADSLGTLRLGSMPLFSNLTVVAGASGYEPGTTLATAVSSAGVELDGRLDRLKGSLDLQVTRLNRLIDDTDEIESLNTQAPSAITLYQDEAFHRSATTPPGVTS